MQNLIEIQKKEIGTEEVNSVNAREIHSFLKVKTEFSHWIKRAIKKYDFLENVDYLTVVKKDGRQTLKDYIVTIDMAKELSMLENNEKGKEIRKYFISCEKKVLNQNQNITPALIEMQKTNQAIIESNQQIVSHLTQMNEGLHQMLTTMMNTKSEVSKIKETINDDRRYMRKLDQGLDNIGYQLMGAVKKIQNVLKPEELDHIRNAIDKRAKELHIQSGETVSTLTRTIYSYVNGKFGISSYYHLQSEDFMRALKIIDEIEIR